ncbi:NUDIX domain-containing protein [Pelagicoccus sp. SDUM812003]|uniref:NUDIX hydrolase n=1 Tax=Pelagicoccus sp. SDUM812003 TaxID=3041267 RepID=UPI00280C6D06|nr:NUDIX domain-containing protein [Pelagicoccus sp. SDUM812003]MDQ8203068.1 NUDIX domain-containing protein [Pelagicoccus sp. SDUM812003]
MVTYVSDRIIPEHFQYCPSCGTDQISISAQQENKVECAACDFTLYFNPSCSAGALIFDGQGRLLVVERAREPSKGKFGIPGGFTDFGERLEHVVVREAKEETNLDLENVRFFASFPNPYHYKSVIYPVTDTYFLASVDSFDRMEAEKSEVSGIHFVDPKEVPEEQWAFPSLRNVIKLYLSTKA